MAWDRLCYQDISNAYGPTVQEPAER